MLPRIIREIFNTCSLFANNLGMFELSIIFFIFAQFYFSAFTLLRNFNFSLNFPLNLCNTVCAFFCHSFKLRLMNSLISFYVASLFQRFLFAYLEISCGLFMSLSKFLRCFYIFKSIINRYSMINNYSNQIK